jgi:hypothetical protein
MIDPVDYKLQLRLLGEERALAREAGLLAHPRYVANLDAEITATQHAYVGAAVTEIACLRAALAGPLRG